MQINPSEDTLVASTASHQLYVYPLLTPELCAGGGAIAAADGRTAGGAQLRKGDQSAVEPRRLSVNTTASSPTAVVTEEGSLAVDHFRLMSQSFHEGKIMGLDVCSRKPLIATCATDHTVRIWNFETK